jgi:hypothetical protein
MGAAESHGLMDGAMTGVVAAAAQPVLRGRRGASRGGWWVGAWG